MNIKSLFYQNPVGFVASIILAVLSVGGFFIKKEIGFSLVVAFAIVFIISIFYSVLTLKSTIKYVKAINKSLLNGEGEGVEAFPLPAVLCDVGGNIVWYNRQFFEQVVDMYDVNRLTMNDFFDDFSFNEYSQKQIASASFAESEYSAFVCKVNSESRPMLCFYFLDDTHYKSIEREYELSRPFVMMMLIDNIDALARQLTDSRFAVVIGGIELIIEDWLKDHELLLKRVGNGNYLVVGEKRNLDKLCEQKFSVLTKIREYKYKDESFDTTISIGVGSGSSFNECELKAKKSLEMSLSRGGDQASIYTDNGYIYFGGMTNRSNDNSRVSPRQTSANISALLKKYSKAIIVGHKFSDYDAIGAAMGMHFFAECCGLEASIVVDGKTSLAMSLVSHALENGFKDFITPSKAVDLCDDDTVVIIVDTQRQGLIDEPDLFDLAGATVVIDHHRRTDDYISDADVSYNSPSSSSTCEMVSELIEYSTIQGNMPDYVATSLLSGIVLDTKDYVLRTSQRTFESAGFLRDNGADTIKVHKLFAINSEMASLKNEIIADATVHNGFMIGSTNSDSKNIRVITSCAADDMLNIDGVKASFVISKLGVNKFQISARSLGEENVQLIMERINGGGHSTMAASQVKCSSIAAAKELLNTAITEYLKNK